MQSAHAALKQGAQQIVFVQHAPGAGALARTLFLENPKLRVAVVNVPMGHPASAGWVAAEAATNHGFVDAHYDDDGVRREPRLELIAPQSTADSNGLNSALSHWLLGWEGYRRGSAFIWSACPARGAIGQVRSSHGRRAASNLALHQASVAFRYFATDLTNGDAVRRSCESFYA